MTNLDTKYNPEAKYSRDHGLAPAETDVLANLDSETNH